MRRLSVLPLLLLFPLVSASAQFALDVQALVGFGGYFRAGSWTPVHVTVDNLGQPVAGTLELQIDRGDRFGPSRNVLRYARPVELVSGASKAFSFVVPLDTTVYPLTLRVIDNGRTVHEESHELRGRSVPSRLALVLSRRPNLDFLLPLFNTRESRELDVVYPHPNYLPDQWHGYEAVNIIVVHDARMRELTAAQLDAMKRWVALGGRLVISGGTHFGPADAQALAVFGDFTTSGIGTIRLEDAGFLEMGLAIDPSERGAEVVATNFTGYGTRITRIRIGNGDVVVLPVDYANLVRVAPLTSVGLWNTLLGTDAVDDFITTELRRRVFETDILTNQLTLPLYDFPSRLLVGGLAVSYTVGLGAILFWLARGRDRARRWLGAPAIVAVVVAVTVTGHLALTVSLQPAEVLALTVERAELVDEGGYVFVRSETALFARQREDYEVRYEDDPLLIPLERRDHRVTRLVRGTTQTLRVQRWEHENNYSVTVTPFDFYRRVEVGIGYVDVELANRTSQRIRGLVLLRDGFPETIGDLAPGEVVEHASSRPEDRDFESIVWEEYVNAGPLAENRARLLADIARGQRFEQVDPVEYIVVGWTDRPLLPVSVTPEFERHVSLHVLTIPIALPRGDQ